MKIYLNLEDFDKKILTKEQRDLFVKKLTMVTAIARRLNKDGKLSKTYLNRINNLWLFLPREEYQQGFISTKEFHKMFNIKPLELIKLKKALSKFYAILKDRKDSEEKGK